MHKNRYCDDMYFSMFRESVYRVGASFEDDIDQETGSFACYMDSC